MARSDRGRTINLLEKKCKKYVVTTIDTLVTNSDKYVVFKDEWEQASRRRKTSVNREEVNLHAGQIKVQDWKSRFDPKEKNHVTIISFRRKVV